MAAWAMAWFPLPPKGPAAPKRAWAAAVTTGEGLAAAAAAPEFIMAAMEKLVILFFIIS